MAAQHQDAIRPSQTVSAVRARCAALELSEEAAADLIHSECGVSRLRAWRTARGLTLEQMAKELKRLGELVHDPLPLITHQRISAWERGEDMPSPRYLDALCRLFATRPDRLGFGEDYSGASAVSTPPDADRNATASDASPAEPGEAPMKRRDLLRGAAALGLSAAVLEQASDLRTRTSGLFTASAVSKGQLATWEESAYQQGLDYRKIATHEHLKAVLTDFSQVSSALMAPHGLSAGFRLHRIAAQLAAVAGVLLIDLEQDIEAKAWFRTAVLAAAETGDRPLLAWIRTREAMVAYYYGTATEAVHVATSAVALSDGTKGVASAMAPAVLARARARAGDRQGAIQAIQQARRAHDTADLSTPGLYGFPERKLAFYEGEVFSRSGDSRSALTAQDHALHLYGSSERIDPALIRVARARTLIRTGEVDEAANLVRRQVESLSTVELRGTVLAAIREVTDAVPATHRSRQSVADLQELLRDTLTTDA